MLRAPPIPFPADMTFAERLITLRKQHGLTQQALADRAEIHVTLLRRYEAGKTQPNIDTLRRIALALTISADLLLFDENERGPTDDLRSNSKPPTNSPTTKNPPSNASSKASSSPTKHDAGPHKRPSRTVLDASLVEEPKHVLHSSRSLLNPLADEALNLNPPIREELDLPSLTRDRK